MSGHGCGVAHRDDVAMELIVPILVLVVIWLVLGPIWLLIRVNQAIKRSDEASQRSIELSARLSLLERELTRLRESPAQPAAQPSETPLAPTPQPAPSLPTALLQARAPAATSEPAVPSQPRPAIPVQPPPVVSPVTPGPIAAAVTRERPPAPPAISPLPAPPLRPSLPAINWEQFMGVKLFAWLGGLALFLGVWFFIKYSFDQGWISPAIRVAMGFVTGLALLIGGLRLPRPGRSPRRLPPNAPWPPQQFHHYRHHRFDQACPPSTGNSSWV